MTRCGKWIVVLTSAVAWIFAANTLAQPEAPAPEEPVVTEEPARAEEPAPAPAPEPAPEPAAEPESAPAPESPEPSPTEEPAPDAPAPEEPLATPDDESATQPTTEPTTQPATAPTTQPEESPAVKQLRLVAQAMLAERAMEFAQATIREGALDESAFRQAAGLLEAATKLNEREPRYWRLLADAKLQLGDEDGVLAALQGYRKVDPGDVTVQIQLIELYNSRLPSLDKELEYLSGLRTRETISQQVRSHVAVMAARRLLERGERRNAEVAIEDAIKLNPVNIAALELQYQTLPPDAPMTDRASALLSLANANPARPAALAAVGRLLADVGLGKESIDWLQRAVILYGNGENVDPAAYHAALVDYASQMYIHGQMLAAGNIVEQMIKGNPADVDARVLKLVMERGSADKERYAASLAETSEALLARWASTARAIADEPEPEPPVEGETPPPAGPPADPAEVAKQVTEAQDDGKSAMFVSAASDMAWFEIYFNGQPANAAKWVAALATVLPEDNVTLTRLRGWRQLASNKPDEARQTLSAIQETDPLAGLAVNLLDSVAAGGDDAARKASDDAARKLLENYRSGLVGAILTAALRERGLKPEAHPDAQAVRGMVLKFPRGWLDVVDNPQRYYAIRVEPMRVAHRYGEPMFVRVMLQNLSDQHIPIGDDGVIRPGMWFDAEVSAMRAQLISGVAFERISHTRILPARQTIAEYVRIDQGNLLSFINANPTPRLQITGWCMTNPSRRGQGFGPGSAGYKIPFGKKITRVGFQYMKPAELEKTVKEVQEGLPDMKIRNISLLAAYTRTLIAAAGQVMQQGQQAGGLNERQQQELQRAQAMSIELIEHISTAATTDEMPGVAQWARFELARTTDPAQREQAVLTLLADKNWDGRLFGFMAMRFLEPKNAIELAEKAAEAETEECVKTYATELIEVLKRPPAATQPADPSAPGAGEPPAITPPLPPAAPEDSTKSPPPVVVPDAPAPEEAPTDAPADAPAQAAGDDSK